MIQNVMLWQSKENAKPILTGCCLIVRRVVKSVIHRPLQKHPLLKYQIAKMMIRDAMIWRSKENAEPILTGCCIIVRRVVKPAIRQPRVELLVQPQVEPRVEPKVEPRVDPRQKKLKIQNVMMIQDVIMQFRQVQQDMNYLVGFSNGRIVTVILIVIKSEQRFQTHFKFILI